MNLNDNESSLQRTPDTIRQRFYKINIAKYFRNWPCSQILTDANTQRLHWENDRP